MQQASHGTPNNADADEFALVLKADRKLPSIRRRACRVPMPTLDKVVGCPEGDGNDLHRSATPSNALRTMASTACSPISSTTPLSIAYCSNGSTAVSSVLISPAW